MKVKILKYVAAFFIFLTTVGMVSGQLPSDKDKSAWVDTLLDDLARLEAEVVPVEAVYETKCASMDITPLIECRRITQDTAKQMASDQGIDKFVDMLNPDATANLGYTREALRAGISATVSGAPQFLEARYVDKGDGRYFRCKVRLYLKAVVLDNFKLTLREKSGGQLMANDSNRQSFVIGNQPPLTAASASAHSSPGSPPPVPTPSSTKGKKGEPVIILRMHGSNTVGSKLAPALADAFLRKLGASDVKKVDGDNPVEGLVIGSFPDAQRAIEIHAHGSSTAFNDLSEDKCDVGMASRKINPEEVDKLSFLGDMTSIASEHVLALDGIAVIVNKSNPIKTLTMSQLSDIFTGRIKDWSKIGGNPGPVTLYARDDKSGTYDTFKHFVLGKEKLADAKRFESNSQLSDEVSNDPNGIGFTGLPYIKNSKAVAVSDIGTAPIYPNVFTVATEDYPLSRRLYLYSPSNPKNPYTRDFVEFALSHEAQEIVKRDDVGFVSLNIQSYKAHIDENLPVQNSTVFNHYLRTIREAKRLSLNFRFKTNSDELDNRGLRDMERIVNFLKKNQRDFQRLILIGFSDAKGDYQYNYELAFKRSRRVGEELRSRGIFPDNVLSAGEEVPVASNDNDMGRDKNRRVEVWIN
jgi:phosphate transport system substrate-binding protein